MKKILIFDTAVDGHHLEYLHHIYIKAQFITQHEFVFGLPQDFDSVKDKFEWPSAKNLSIILFNVKNKSEQSNCHRILSEGIIIRSLVNRYQITDIFFISLMSILSALPFLMYKKTNVSGIIYNINTFRFRSAGYGTKCREKLKFYLLANLSIVSNVFVLNNPFGRRYLNILFRVSKFSDLPDPVNIIPMRQISNLRKDLSILPSFKVFLHFGQLTQRKGTLELLRAIIKMNPNCLDKKCFIFAGIVSDEIKQEFYRLLKVAEKRVMVLCFDQFCDYTFLGSLCYSSDFILIPYKITYQSSGLLGYAAQFNVPVIAPHNNLIGRIVEEYKLGYTLERTDCYSIAKFLCEIDKVNQNVCSKAYLDQNSIDHFNSIIFKQWDNRSPVIDSLR